MNRRDALLRLGSCASLVSLTGRPVRALAQLAPEAPADTVPVRRHALVMGNGRYSPDRAAILTSRKNVLDVSEALRNLEFEVAQDLDVPASTMRARVIDFFTKLRSNDSTRMLAVFYYTGHGIQYRGDNFLVPSDVIVNQNADAMSRGCINVDKELFTQVTLPNDGSSVLIFDACRNDPTQSKMDVATSFNQVVPPRGTVITFSTAPGRYAIAPRSPDENSIFTGILVDELKKANANISIKDFLDAVKFRVRNTMESSPEPFLRRHAQDPEVAANLRLPLSFAVQKIVVPVPDAEQVAWAEIAQTIEPHERAKLLENFKAQFPESRFNQAADVQLTRAVISEKAAAQNRLRADTTIGDVEFRADQAKALDGDKDAALRVAYMFRDGTNGVTQSTERMVQWLRQASDLNSGIASYRLYRYYIEQKLDRQTTQYRQRFINQGYTPPPELDDRKR